MVKKLTRHGNSMALVIERSVMELLNIQDDTPLNITTDGNVLVVSPLHSPKRKKLLEAALAKTNEQYGRMLKKLAD